MNEFVTSCQTTASSFLDRKSTRLNSSHTVISYAVFCLKKKKDNEELHVRLVNLILLLALKHGASYIHVAPGDETLGLRNRIDCILQGVEAQPKRGRAVLVSRARQRRVLSHGRRVSSLVFSPRRLIHPRLLYVRPGVGFECYSGDPDRPPLSYPFPLFFF